MNRTEAIAHIWGLSSSVAGEFCCTKAERDELSDETEEALRVLGVTAQEMAE